jgi:hypothetical protein
MDNKKDSDIADIEGNRIKYRISQCTGRRQAASPDAWALVSKLEL